MAKYITHDFFCIHCGNKGVPISRQAGRMREKGHYKNLYCVYCKDYTRHLEVHNEIDISEFKENFQKGVYINDATNDKASCGMSSVWKNFLG